MHVRNNAAARSCNSAHTCGAQPFGATVWSNSRSPTVADEAVQTNRCSPTKRRRPTAHQPNSRMPTVAAQQALPNSRIPTQPKRRRPVSVASTSSTAGIAFCAEWSSASRKWSFSISSFPRRGSVLSERYSITTARVLPA
eukprot:1736136-Rhodomonas_salina.1